VCDAQPHEYSIGSTVIRSNGTAKLSANTCAHDNRTNSLKHVSNERRTDSRANNSAAICGSNVAPAIGGTAAWL
jgi:hypothetical protein